MPTPSDQPGWRPDPERPGMVRWWNGLGWSDARRSAEAAGARVREAAQEAVHASTITPAQVGKTVADSPAARRAVTGAGGAVAGAAVGANPFAAVALTIGVMGFIIGLGGVVSLIAAVLSLAGLVRSRRLAQQGAKRTGFGRSMAGLLVSVIGLVRWLPTLAVLWTEFAQNVVNS